MTAPQWTTSIRGVDPLGQPTDPIPCRLLAQPQRTLGLGGDTLQVIAPAQAWPAKDTDTSIKGEFSLTMGLSRAGGEQITLAGYIFRRAEAAVYGTTLAFTPGTQDHPPAFATELLLTFESCPGVLRDGRGGIIRDRLINQAGPDGVAVADDPDLTPNTQLASIALLSMGVQLTPADLPASLDDHLPPAALAWGNADAVAELEALLARAGHAVSYRNDASFHVVELPQADQAITIPQDILPDVDALELEPANPLRATTLVITSGQSRSTIVGARTLDQMEWVWYDDRTGRWLNTAQTQALYPGETTPDDINALRAGPGKSPEERERHRRLFSAVRLAGPDREALRRLVAIRQSVSTAQGLTLGGVPATALALIAEEGQDSQLVMADAPVQLAVTAHQDEGVAAFSRQLVRLPAGRQAGSIKEAVALTGADLQIIFAREARTGDYDTDYFARAYQRVAGQVVEISDPIERELAIGDIFSVHVAQTAFRRLLAEAPDGMLTPLNDDALSAAALSLARARVASEGALSGVVIVRGLKDISPGDWGGAVTRVQWERSARGVFTKVEVNQHEAPGSVYDALELAAERSIAAGLRRYSLPGASAAQSDVCSGAATLFPASAAGPSPAGREREAGLSPQAQSPAGRALRTLNGDTWLSRIHGPTSLGPGRWSYGHEEVKRTAAGAFVAVAGGRTDIDLGPALNLAEALNDGAGVEASGVDRANLPTDGGWAMVPLGEQIVRMTIVVDEGGGETPMFHAVNFDDGSCVQPAALSGEESLALAQMAGAAL